MANKTLKQMRQLIEANHPEILGSELFTEPYLNELINNAQLNVQMNLAGLALQKFETTLTATCVNTGYLGGVNTTSIALSSITNLLSAPKSIKYIRTYYEVAKGAGFQIYQGEAIEVDDTKFWKLARSSYGADYMNGIFCIEGAQVQVYPRKEWFTNYPASEPAWTLVYIRRCTPLTADSTALEIPEEYEHFVAKQVGIEIQAALGQIQKKDEAIQELMMKLQKAQQDFVDSLSPVNNNEISPIGEGARLQ